MYKSCDRCVNYKATGALMVHLLRQALREFTLSASRCAAAGDDGWQAADALAHRLSRSAW